MFYFLSFLEFFQQSFAIGAEVQVSEEDSAIILEQFESLIDEIDAIGIFTHNTSLALPMFIPGFGIAWGAFAAFSTGIAFSVLKDASPMLANVPSLTILFMSPFGLMEVAAYSIAMSRSYMIVHKMIKRMPIRPDFRVIGIEISILDRICYWLVGLSNTTFIESISYRYAKNLSYFISFVVWRYRSCRPFPSSFILKSSSSFMIKSMFDHLYLLR